MKKATKLVDEVVSSLGRSRTRIVRLIEWSEREGACGPLIQWDRDGDARRARWSASLTAADLKRSAANGADAVVVCTDEDELVILSLLAPDEVPNQASGDVPEVVMDGKKLELTAQEELVLRCGDALIRLTKDGRLFLRGIEVETRAQGANRIRGGTVEFN